MKKQGDYMGAWGIALSSSDTYSDVYSSFYNLFNEGKPIDKIMEKINQDFSDIINDEDEKNDFYYAIAKAQWECGYLEDAYRIAIENIVNQNLEISRWERMGGSKNAGIKRQEKVKRLLQIISSANERIKKPKPKKLRNSFCKKGDCVVIIDSENNFSAAVALSDEENTEWGLNLMLVLKYYDSIKPNKSFFETADCLLEKNWKDRYEPLLIYCNAKDAKKLGDKIELIGNIRITIDYEPEFGKYYGSWVHICESSKRLTNIELKAKPVKAKNFYKKGIFG